MNELLIVLAGVTVVVSYIWLGWRERDPGYRAVSWLFGILIVLLMLGLIERLIFIHTHY